MQLMDSSPERRNLIVFSLVIILFIVGNGQVGDEISLPFTSIKLTNSKNVLIVFWLIYLYVNFRYFLSFRSSVFEGMNLSLSPIKPTNWRSSSSMAILETKSKGLVSNREIWYLNTDNKKTKVDLIEAFRKHNPSSGIDEIDVLYEYREATRAFRLDAKFKGSLFGKTEWLPIGILGSSGLVKGVVLSSVRNPYFTSWYMPWLLSVVAVGMSIYRYVHGLCC